MALWPLHTQSHRIMLIKSLKELPDVSDWNEICGMARDLQAFLVFSQHPAWVITPVNP